MSTPGNGSFLVGLCPANTKAAKKYNIDPPTSHPDACHIPFCKPSLSDLVPQEIPLLNTGEQTMAVSATLLGPSKAFTGNREAYVPPGATIPYVLSFKPTTQGIYICWSAASPKVHIFVGVLHHPRCIYVVLQAHHPRIDMFAGVLHLSQVAKPCICLHR